MFKVLEKIIDFIYEKDIFEITLKYYRIYFFGFVFIRVLVAENMVSDRFFPLIMPLSLLLILYLSILIIGYKSYRQNGKKRQLLTYLLFLNINLLILLLDSERLKWRK